MESIEMRAFTSLSEQGKTGGEFTPTWQNGMAQLTVHHRYTLLKFSHTDLEVPAGRDPDAGC